MSIPLKGKPHLMQKIEKALNDTTYRHAIETSSNYNNRLIAERASRLPFIDLQTGVAQNNCTLWMNRWERMPGSNQGQVYSYPAHRWRKNRRSYLLNNVFSNKINLEYSVSDKNEVIGASSGNGNDSCAIDYPIETENVDSNEKCEPNKDICQGNPGEPEETLSTGVSEISELGDIDDPETEEEEDNSSGAKKKIRKKYAKRKKASEYTDAEKPYTCDLCGIKYKTRPGLSYHYAHTHANLNIITEPSGSNSNGANQNSQMANDCSSSGAIFHDGMDDGKDKDFKGIKDNKNSSKDKENMKKVCDLCLSNTKKNKRGVNENLVTCNDCSRSAHPSCLDFTPHMIKAIARYPWQCVECKACCLCESTDNDDKLLICDDCDRGYHLFCLEPPLKELPEGFWNCILCRRGISLRLLSFFG